MFFWGRSKSRSKKKKQFKWHSNFLREETTITIYSSIFMCALNLWRGQWLLCVYIVSDEHKRMLQQSENFAFRDTNNLVHFCALQKKIVFE